MTIFCDALDEWRSSSRREAGALQIDGGEFFVSDGNPGWVAPPVELCSDLQSSLGGRAGDQVDNDVVTDQGLATPVLRDVAEHTMLNLVPFAGARREMADMDGQAQLARQVLQRDFPEPAAAAVATAAIGGDQQLAGARVA